jgi:hypothetical protein
MPQFMDKDENAENDNERNEGIHDMTL